MITQKTLKYFIPIHRYYFDYKKEKKSLYYKLFWITEVINIQQKNIPWFNKEEFHTGVIDLSNNIEDIFNDFSKTKRNEIRRAEKEGVMYEVVEDFMTEEENYRQFYNLFAKDKWLPILQKNHFHWIEKNIVLTKWIKDNMILVYHLYLIDKNIGKVRLLQSCSLFRKEKELKKIIAYGNNGLHFFDIKYFQQWWIQQYDFWWLYLWTADQQRVNIDKFKLWFWLDQVLLYNQQKYWIIINIFNKILYTLWTKLL